MGRDKALLELDGVTLVERIAGCVREAAGHVTLVGAPKRYSGLGYAVLPDLVEDVGPMGGILTALRHSGSEWNLVVACDMPNVNSGFLRQLLDEALARNAGCLAPETSDGVHPLCAVYHRRVLPALQQAVDHKLLKMQDFLKSIDRKSTRLNSSH